MELKDKIEKYIKRYLNKEDIHKDSSNRIEEFMNELEIKEEYARKVVFSFLKQNQEETIYPCCEILKKMSGKYTNGSSKEYYELFCKQFVESIPETAKLMKEYIYIELFVEYLFSLVVHSRVEGEGFLNKSRLPVKFN